MKKLNILKKWILILVIPFLPACKYEYPLPVVNADLKFAKNGLQTYNTNSEYDNETIEVTISRIYGLSKEIEMKLAVDEALVQEYNSLNSTNYKALGSKYFSVPNTVTFPANTKDVKISVTLNPNAMVKDMGYDAANNVILPIKLESANVTADFVENASSVLLKPVIAAPLITVEVSASRSLSFLTSVPIAQNVTINSTANFKTVDVSKVSFVADASKVAEFNAANGTQHVILPSANYTIAEDVFDPATLNMKSTITINGSTLDDTKTYLLPLVLQQTKTYGIRQEQPVYIVVTLTDLRVWPVDGGNLVKIGGAQGTIGFKLNSPLLEDLNVPLLYDAGKVAIYNAANATSYLSLNASKIQLGAGKIVAGGLTGNGTYQLDIGGLGYDDGKEYLIPVTIDESQLTQGARVTDKPTVYLKLVKTITGNYTKQALKYTPSQPNSADGNNNFNTLVKLADGTASGFSKSATAKKQKYAINYNKGWSDGVLYFNIEATEMAGKPGCYRIIDLQDRPYGEDPTSDIGSYFDSNTGEIYFNLSILGYWNTTEINLRLYNRTNL